jgi:hypothetical protein
VTETALDEAAELLDGAETLHRAALDNPQATELDRTMAAGFLTHAEGLVRNAVTAAPEPGSTAEAQAGAGL